MLRFTITQAKRGRVNLWRQSVKAVPLIVLALLLITGAAIVPSQVSADRFDEQIRQLQQQNNNTQGALASLQGEAATYQEAINRLQIQIKEIQRQIDANVAKQNELQARIEEGQRELDRQRHILGVDIKAMYVDGDITTIEMLATSKDLSEFVDKETYRNAVQRKIQETLKKIQKLQNELKEQKVEVERLLQEQSAQRQQLNSSKSEQSSLLAYNQHQQNEFNQQLKDNNSKIAELRRKQAEENCRIFGCGGGITGGGGYPWGYAKCIHTGQVEGYCYNYDWAVNGDIWNWKTGGWGYRNCTDWVAFRSGGRVPSAGTIRAYSGANSGNAKWWDNAASNMGRQADSSPSRGDTAVSNAGEYGHVLYVEDVHADGSISLSDYNRAGTGKYDFGTFEKESDGVYRSPTGRTYSLTFVTW